MLQQSCSMVLFQLCCRYYTIYQRDTKKAARAARFLFCLIVYGKRITKKYGSSSDLLNDCNESKNKKNAFLFCTLLTFSYLCTVAFNETVIYEQIHQSVYGRRLQTHLRTGDFETSADWFPKQSACWGKDDCRCQVPEFRTDVALTDLKTKELFSDKLRLIYLQLPYFEKEADECENVFERLIYVLKNMDILNRMPWAAQDSVFQKLASIAEVASLSKQERQLYDESLRQYRDTLVVMEGQYLEGEEKGRAEGKQEVARIMKDNSVSAEQISLYTGLSIQDIENL